MFKVVPSSIKRPILSEACIQKAFFQWISHYKNVRKLTFAIPNGGMRNIKEAFSLKLQGVLAGVPDIFMAIPKNEFHGLFIEFKSEKGKLSLYQRNKIVDLEAQGYKVLVCKSLIESMDGVKEYLEGDYLIDRKQPTEVLDYPTRAEIDEFVQSGGGRLADWDARARDAWLRLSNTEATRKSS